MASQTGSPLYISNRRSDTDSYRAVDSEIHSEIPKPNPYGVEVADLWRCSTYLQQVSLVPKIANRQINARVSREHR